MPLYNTSGFVPIVTLCTNSALQTFYTLFPLFPVFHACIMGCYDLWSCVTTTQDTMSEVTKGEIG